MMRKLMAFVLLMLAFGALEAAAQGTCTLSVTTLNFGTYTGTALNGTATGTVVCNGGWQILMYTGTGAGATETTRYMTGPNGTELSYRLFTDSARTNNWGNTTGNEVTGSGNATVTVYGQVLSGQTVQPGTYVDTMSTATTTFQVTAVIPGSCTIAASTLAFGTYSGSALSGTSTLTAKCTNLLPYNIGLNAGSGTGATTTMRKMSRTGGGTLNYSMYQDSGHGSLWGNTIGTNTRASTGNGNSQTFTIYGLIPASQVTTQGTYTDTVTVTVTY